MSITNFTRRTSWSIASALQPGTDQGAQTILPPANRTMPPGMTVRIEAVDGRDGVERPAHQQRGLLVQAALTCGGIVSDASTNGEISCGGGIRLKLESP